MNRYTISMLLLSLLCSCQINNIKNEFTDIKKSDCNISDKTDYDLDKIIQEQRLELGKENLKANFNILIDQKIDFLKKAKQDSKKLFPYSIADSGIYIRYDEYDSKAKMSIELKERKPKFAKVLCKEKIAAIINWANNPNNFGYGECGTPIAEAHILFFSKGKKISEIIFACGHRQIICEPENVLINFGGLNEIGNKKLDEIAPWK